VGQLLQSQQLPQLAEVEEETTVIMLLEQEEQVVQEAVQPHGIVQVQG
jgi:hypothetical protein